ncbi:MAG: hypothetical protein AAF206_19315 [Bacteroidota bacterium]
MDIQTITLEHTNPSLGPHETITIVSLEVSKPHLDRVRDFIQAATVNNTISLEAYLTASITRDTNTLDQVHANGPKGKLTSGSGISNLQIHLKDGTLVELYDVYRRFRLTHFYPDFTQYMVDNGSMHKHQPYSSPFLKEKDIAPKPPHKLD